MNNRLFTQHLEEEYSIADRWRIVCLATEMYHSHLYYFWTIPHMTEEQFLQEVQESGIICGDL